jgi:hypothetical protein
LRILLFSIFACLVGLSTILYSDAIPWTSEEDRAQAADSIVVGRIMSYQDNGTHRYYEISIIKWIKNPQSDRTITMRSITPEAFDPHFPFAIFQKKDLGLFYLSLIDGKWQSTNYSRQIWASELSDTIDNMKKLVGNNNPDSSVTLERVCKEGYVNAVKNRTGEIACVKPQTLQKLRERGWAEPLGGVVFQKPSEMTESTVSCPNQNMCTISVEGVILKSLPDRHESTYYFFTNDNIGSVKTGATGIPLEINQDKTIPTDLHGKVIKLRGQMFLEPFSKIFVEDLQIVRDLIPTLSYNITDYREIEQSNGKTKTVTMNELFQNPAKYYWKHVSVKGLLKERGAVGVPSIECISVNFEESQEFRFESFRSPYVLEGIVHDNDVAVDARLGIRLESGKEYKFVDWERLPPDLKDKNVVVDGVFQPTVSNSGICKAVLHPAGYILTTFDKITIAD